MKKFALIVFICASVILHGQDGLFTHFSSENGLSGQHVFAVTEDNTGNVLVATDGGISILKGFEFATTPYPKKADYFIGLLNDQNNEVWGYTPSGLFFKNNGSNWNEIALNPQLKKAVGQNIVNMAILDSSHHLWMSGIIGPLLLELNPEKPAIEDKTKSIPTSTFWIKSLGNKLICGSNLDALENEAILVLETKNGIREIPLSGKKGYNKSRIIKLEDNTYLFAAGSEVVRFSESQVSERLFTEKNVECIFQDQEGKIWIGLNQGGLLCFPTGNISSSNRIEYLGNATVSTIYEDRQFDLWFGTLGNGVYTYSSTPELTYQAPQISAGKDTATVKKQQAIRLDQDPEILTLERVVWDTVPPEIFISSIEINNRDTALKSKYILPADQNFLRIGFVGSLPGNPGLFQYKYKLSGVDKDWVYSSMSAVSYTMLPPGTYDFEVSAMSKEGIWSKKPARVTFKIEPHYYQTTWFKALLAGLVAIFISLGLVIYTRNIRRKEAEKAQVNKRIADLELMALRAQMNPHFLFNTLSSIQHFVSSNNTEEALRYLSKFAKLMRVVLDNSKRKEIPINDEIKAITLYLDLEKLRFKNKFDYKIEVGEGLDPSYDEIPSMLIQPYLENAILHGINNKHGKGFINVKLDLEGENIVCRIEDDGVGRKRAAELSKKRSKEHKSQGMSITRDRLSIINRVNESDLSVVVEDIYEGENTGTRVKIYVPFKNF